MILAILAVIILISLLVLLHEWGHFIVARRNGIVVEEFGIGFPPRLFGRKFGQTLYSVNALPLGGFVRLKGEDGTDQSPDSFNAATFATKAKVLLAGVGMNALTAYVILLALCLTGLPPVMENQFSLGQPTYVQPKQVMVVGVGPNSVAKSAGLTAGDVILSGNGQKFESEKDLISFTKANAGKAAELRIKSQEAGVEKEIQVTLNDDEKAKKDGHLGVTPLQVYKLRYGWTAPLVALGLLGQIMLGTLQAFGGLIAGLLVHGKVAAEVTGPVGIVVIFNSIARLGLSYVAIFMVSISASLAVINVLPVPALDGGRFALIAAQKVLKRRLSSKLEARIHLIGFVALIALMVVVTYFDIRGLK